MSSAPRRRAIRMTPSTRKPMIRPMSSFAPSIFKMTMGSTCSAMKMGSISSEVERNTAISVPNVITRPAYSVAAAAENPHWGNTPSTAPIAGPAAPALRIAASALSPALCSSASMARYVTNKKGTSRSVSISECSKICKTISMAEYFSRIKTHTGPAYASVDESQKKGTS